jgi:very-short-patch-repair endonuclease/predicted transcriptional regulator of viral defense system
VSERGDRALAVIAAAQRGVVSRRQLTAVGLGRSAIAHRIAKGRLHRLHRGVYLLGHAVPPRLAPEIAALLSCGDDAVLSHRTAAALWGIASPADHVDVTVVGRDCGRRCGVQVHRVRRLDLRDRALRDRIPITAPARTLLDLAETIPPPDIERALAEALVRKLTTEAQLQRLLSRSLGRRGSRALRTILSQSSGPALTRSEAERKLLDLIRAGRLPHPQTNAKVGRYEVDFLWARQRLIVEVDGYAFHSSRAAFERDRTRDGDLQAQGFAVLRLTWRQITEEPHPVLVHIAQLLAARGAGSV